MIAARRMIYLYFDETFFFFFFYRILYEIRVPLFAILSYTRWLLYSWVKSLQTLVVFTFCCRWLRKKALESEHRRISQRHRAVEERLSSSPSKSKEVLDRFFESEHFASVNRKQQDNLQRNSKFTVLNGNA